MTSVVAVPLGPVGVVAVHMYVPEDDGWMLVSVRTPPSCDDPKAIIIILLIKMILLMLKYLSRKIRNMPAGCQKLTDKPAIIDFLNFFSMICGISHF